MQTYKLEPTKNKNLFRVVDLKGDWKNYFWKPTGQYLRSVTDILNEGFAKGKFFEIWLKNKSAAESEEILNNAGDRGSRVHKMIDFLLANGGKANRGITVFNEEMNASEMLNVEEWSVTLTWTAWWSAHAPLMIVGEYPVYNLKVGYAGTCDFIGILTKECDKKQCPCHNIIGKVGIFDWKTSSGIRDSYGAQLAAYGNSTNIKKFDFTAVVRIGTKHACGYEFEAYDKEETANHWQEFLAAKTISEAGHTNFNPDKEIYEISDVIDIEIKKQVKVIKKVEPKKAKKTELLIIKK